ncbi:hypothetical protein DIPPA_05275 [Diplonema papillatum]|nr:hypothetical protein DIPPA_05275 [Diplonema papillatum]
MDEIHDQLLGEVEKGWLEGPFTVNNLPVDRFVPIKRFIVVQGEKRRGCDDARPTNAVTSIQTPISLMGIDNATATAIELGRNGVAEISQAVLDQSDAYKSLIVDPAQRKYAVIVALNPISGELDYFLSNVLCFGTESAVLNYNCLSRVVSTLARRILCIPASGYFYDFLMQGRAEDIEQMATDFQILFGDIVGLIFKDTKKRVGPCIPYLGVQID